MWLQVSVACKQKHLTMTHLKVVPTFFFSHPSRRTVTQTQHQTLQPVPISGNERQPTLFCTNGMTCNKEDKQMPQEEMDGGSNICSPPLWQTDGADTWRLDPKVTHLACLSGLSNSEGRRWEQSKKKKENKTKQGTVLSQAGKASHVTEPSVRNRRPGLVFGLCDGALTIKKKKKKPTERDSCFFLFIILRAPRWEEAEKWERESRGRSGFNECTPPGGSLCVSVRATKSKASMCSKWNQRLPGKKKRVRRLGSERFSSTREQRFAAHSPIICAMVFSYSATILLQRTKSNPLFNTSRRVQNNSPSSYFTISKV